MELGLFDFEKERQVFEQELISYDKLRWPVYRDLVF